MKYSVLLAGLLFVVITGFSQSANCFKYQAVVRNNQGEVLAGQDVAFRISLLIDSENGSVVFFRKAYCYHECPRFSQP